MPGNVRKLMSSLIAFIFLVFTTGTAWANSFAGTGTNGWTMQKPKGVFDLAVDWGQHPSLMKNQLPGDWVLTTQLTYSSAPQNNANQAGLVIYKDDGNYLIWGQKGNSSMELSGIINGSPTPILLATSAKYTHMRIIKRSGEDAGAHTRYYFYGTFDGAESDYRAWQYVGYWEDTNELFLNGKYGLMARDWGNTKYVAQFDWCEDFTLEMYKDFFQSANLDGPWHYVNPRGYSSYSMDGENLVMNVDQFDNEFPGSDGASMILRRELPVDWTIEAEITSNSAPVGSNTEAGLTIYHDSNNWLMLGQKGNNSMEAGGVLNGSWVTSLTASGTYRFIKIIKAGNTYFFKISNTGQSWTDLGTINDTTGGLIQPYTKYGFMGKGWGGANYTVKFNWFLERPRPDGIIKDIDWFQEVGKITGEASLNHTETNWGWGSGDLGSMYDLNGTTYMSFGDTFQNVNQGGNWYRNSLAQITNPSFANGLIFDTMKGTGPCTQPNCGLVGPRGDDMSMIPTFGVGVGNTNYMYIMEIRHWGDGGHWDTNGGAWATSTDGGSTWTLQPQLFTGNSNFEQLAITKVGTTLYMLGASGGGFGTVKLAKVDQSSILNRANYTFWNGSGWSPNEQDAVPVINSVNREIALEYNPYLGEYLMTTLDNVNQEMIVREAPNPWGPWGKPILLFDEAYVSHENPSVQSFYGSFMLQKYMQTGAAGGTVPGELTYMTLNKWNPYEITWEKVHFLK